MQLANLIAHLGDAEGAIKALEQAVDNHEFYSAWFAADPRLAEILGDDPRYQVLLRRIGIPLP